MAYIAPFLIAAVQHAYYCPKKHASICRPCHQVSLRTVPIIIGACGFDCTVWLWYQCCARDVAWLCAAYRRVNLDVLVL